MKTNSLLRSPPALAAAGAFLLLLLLAAGDARPASASVTITATGRFVYQDDSGQLIGIRNAKVVMYDDDMNDNPWCLPTFTLSRAICREYMGETQTDADGYFTVTGSAGDGLCTGTCANPDPYVQVEATSAAGTVMAPGLTGSTYCFTTAPKWNQDGSSTVQFGTARPENAQSCANWNIWISGEDGAWQVHNTIREAWEFVRGYSLANPGVDIPPVYAYWPTGGSWVYDHKFDGGINLPDAAAWKEAIVMHEYGHHVLSTLAEDNSGEHCKGGCYSPNWIWGADDPASAWTQGWTWYLAEVMTRHWQAVNGRDYDTFNDIYGCFFRLEDGNVVWYCSNDAIETPPHYPDGSHYGNPKDAEGHSAAVLWDLQDSAQDDHDNNGSRDRVSENFAVQWDVLMNYDPAPWNPDHNHPRTADQFWDGIRARWPQLSCRLTELYEENHFTGKPRCDLQLDSLTAPPAGVGQGQSFQVMDTVSNWSTLQTGASSVTRFYLSTDNIITPSDTAIGERTVGNVWGNGGLDTGSATVVVPWNMPYGTYYLGACADASGQLFEANETNNCLAGGQLTVRALSDLAVDSITTNPLYPVPGQPVQVTVRVTNSGADAAGFRIDFYKHKEIAPTASEAGNVWCYVSGLAAGASYDCVGTVSYDWSGTYKMAAQADTLHQVPEWSEANNILWWVPLTVGYGPDLTVLGSPTANPASPRAGQPVQLSATIKNQGNETAESDRGACRGNQEVCDEWFFVDLYSDSWSPPPVGQTEGDIYCGVYSLAPGATTTCSGTVVYSTSGWRGVWAQVDLDDNIDELSESNQMSYGGRVNVRVVNDDFEAPVSISALPYANIQDTKPAFASHPAIATLEASEPQPCGGIGSTVWYSFTSPTTTTLSATTSGSDFDTVLAVYTGSNLASLANIGCNDDIAPGNAASVVIFTAYAGVTYHFQAGGYGAANGDLLFFNLLVLDTDGDGIGDTLDACPQTPEDFDGHRDDDGCPEEGNDFFEDAWTISALPFVNTQGTGWAYLEPGEPRPCGLIGKTVWYVFTPAVNTSLIVHTVGSSFDTVLAVYSGSQLGSLNLLGCDNDGAGGVESRLYLDLPAGQSYYFQAGGYNGASGSLALNLMAVDMDGDGIGDGFDNCPYWYNPTQALPPWPVPADDWDCDGWSNSDEGSIGTNPLWACGVGAWPPDLNDDTLINIQDILEIPPHLGKTSAAPGWDPRYDLDTSTLVNVQDILAVVTFLGKTCTS